MTSLSSSFRSPRSHNSSSFFLLLMVAVGVSSAAGCADKHIGRPCETGLPVEGNTAKVSDQALECPSRICLLPALAVSPQMPPTGPSCTDYCNGDDDCSDGEARNGTTNPNGCKNGFACRIAIGKLENPLACKRVCVCKDFLTSEESMHAPPKPPSCPP